MPCTCHAFCYLICYCPPSYSNSESKFGLPMSRHQASSPRTPSRRTISAKLPASLSHSLNMMLPSSSVIKSQGDHMSPFTPSEAGRLSLASSSSRALYNGAATAGVRFNSRPGSFWCDMPKSANFTRSLALLSTIFLGSKSWCQMPQEWMKAMPSNMSVIKQRDKGIGTSNSWPRNPASASGRQHDHTLADNAVLPRHGASKCG